ncbi:unnamed protein product [Prorocentrum cordatum]|uniref:EF-hand domain-containing protein n=1 Tax=Prorocentrum cordatum TaxID=2364126 RepID=A0ABN9Y3Q6_9DINO|nr:unnamed protein product [Polarella glacialis]
MPSGMRLRLQLVGASRVIMPAGVHRRSVAAPAARDVGGFGNVSLPGDTAAASMAPWPPAPQKAAPRPCRESDRVRQASWVALRTCAFAAGSLTPSGGRLNEESWQVRFGIVRYVGRRLYGIVQHGAACSGPARSESAPSPRRGFLLPLPARPQTAPELEAGASRRSSAREAWDRASPSPLPAGDDHSWSAAALRQKWDRIQAAFADSFAASDSFDAPRQQDAAGGPAPARAWAGDLTIQDAVAAAQLPRAGRRSQTTPTGGAHQPMTARALAGASPPAAPAHQRSPAQGPAQRPATEVSARRPSARPRTSTPAASGDVAGASSEGLGSGPDFVDARRAPAAAAGRLATRREVSRRARRLAERSQIEQKRLRLRAQWRRDFEAMSEADQEFYRRAFKSCDFDVDGVLEGAELVPCLKEVGLNGFKAEERYAIRQVVDQWLSENSEEVDLFEFVAGLVPLARRTIEDVRSNELLRKYLRNTSKDADADCISAMRCAEIARDMGLDARHFFQQGQEDRGVPFEEFRQAIVRMAEGSERLQRDRERALAEREGLDGATFAKFRTDLIWLHAIFSQYDADGSGKLDQAEIMRAVREFGVTPCAIEDRLDLKTMAKVDFREFLAIIGQIRERGKLLKVGVHKFLFSKYDRDGDGTLSVREIAPLLEQLRLTPRNRVEQEELAALINGADENGSGQIEFSEFQDFCQKVEERLNRVRFEDELAQALAMEFSTAQLRDMRWAFDSLDADASGRLQAEELCECLTLMGKSLKKDEFDLFFKELDADGSGELEFKEFLEFMRVVRDRESIFSDSFYKHFHRKPHQLEPHVLRRVLENMRMAKNYTIVLDRDELVDVFCGYFGISPDDDLEEKFGVKSVEELYELSRRWDSERTAAGP